MQKLKVLLNQERSVFFNGSYQSDSSFINFMRFRFCVFTLECVD